MNRNQLRGTGVALVTPFHKDGSVDFKSLKKLVNRCIESKVEYLVPLGTTGESVTLSRDEKRAVLDFVIEVNDGRVPVVLGLGGNNTRDIVNTIEETDFENIDAILSVSPYYNRPPQKGIFLHYRTIANASPVPVILYNVPARTGSTIEAETTLELAHEVKNIIGVKEASGSMERVMKIVKEKPKDFLVISGDDLLSLPIIALGGDGVISVIANAMPKDFSEMVRAALEGNYEKSRKLHYRLHDITKTIYLEGSPSGVKGLLSALDVCAPHLRLPLINASSSLMKKFEELLYEKVGH